VQFLWDSVYSQDMSISFCILLCCEIYPFFSLSWFFFCDSWMSYLHHYLLISPSVCVHVSGLYVVHLKLMRQEFCKKKTSLGKEFLIFC
jgi:hypothetical protein